MFVTIAVCSFLLGVGLTLLSLYLIYKSQLRLMPQANIPHVPQFAPYKLPKELLKLLKDPGQLGKKEDCIYLNLLFQFLFKELKDSKRIRQWAVRKMNVEFEEMMQTTTGKLIDQISVRDFSMGSSFPVLKSVAVQKAKIEHEDHLEVLDLAMDIDYSGGFQLAVDIDLVFGKWAYLCVTITSLRGMGRLQLSRQPYTHWSFSFYEEPQITFSIASRYGGKALPQITSLVITQIKRSLRKKHILPNYKMRFRPFFDRPEEFKPVKELRIHGNRIGEGQLQVTIVECSRLSITEVPANCQLYCTLSLDNMQWSELVELQKKVWDVLDIEIATVPTTSIGLNMKEDFLLEKYEDVVVVDSVVPKSPAAMADVRKGDILVSVGTSRVTSSKQAKKLFKNAGDRFTVRIERPKSKGQQYQDVPQTEETFLSLDVDGDSVGQEKSSDQTEDFVHISFKLADYEDKKVKPGVKDVTEKQGQVGFKDTAEKMSQKQGVMSLVNTGKALLQRKVKGQIDGDKVSASLSSSAVETSARTPKVLTHTQSASSSPRKEANLKSARQRAHSDTSLITVQDDLDDDGGSDGEDLPDQDDQSCDKHKTEEVASRQNPKWNEKFMLHVDKDDCYLNVCVWCKIPPKLDKHDRVIKPGKEILLGHVSLPVPDICLDCLMTTQGDSQHTIPLVHADPRAGASRAKFSNLASHKGFEPSLCNGDITLAFWHKPFKMSDEVRKKMTRVKGEVHTESLPPDLPPAVAKEAATDSIKKIEEGRHDFTGTNFNTATYCDLCGKKIWLKEGSQCYTCSIICHKKCMEKCQAQTLCTLKGPKVRNFPSQSWKIPITRAEAERRKAKEGAAQKTGGLLSKFRKDSSLERKQAAAVASTLKAPSPERLTVPQSSPNLSPQLSPQLIRRRNSAPAPDKDGGAEVEKQTSSESWLSDGSHSFPHTRSTTSIQSLTSSLSNSDMIFKEKELFDSSDESDGEMAAELQERMAKMKKVKGHNNLDEMVVMAAKEMGKELFAELSLEERKEKLDNMVMKLQKEIDKESENKTELLRMEQDVSDPAQKDSIRKRQAKSDEKVEAMMMMMLHYCAGLQYCLDQEGEDRQRAKSQPTMEPIMDELVVTDVQKGDSASSESEKEASFTDVIQKTSSDLPVSDQKDLNWCLSESPDTDFCVGTEHSQAIKIKGTEIPSFGVHFKNCDQTVMFTTDTDEEDVGAGSDLVTSTAISDGSLELDDDECDKDEEADDRDVTLSGQLPMFDMADDDFELSLAEDKII
ncbi:PDZ domain-containing protein 8-like [Mizuhopecten yessoensis]|uniref:PDZ domain-containing protein 8-like n=1 Tax=Mizuhopecten yessoensis TaxID=6573 RepID=UPI000B457B0B|nr:PDZ domain-containing protein 8-like [Mizuhopecten yessoensis]